jgi:hypothetical protein
MIILSMSWQVIRDTPIGMFLAHQVSLNLNKIIAVVAENWRTLLLQMAVL